ncbi:prephenate dehydrogenase/arogenate dehydrogenase family protein [Candidatus Palauibacter sp.]|uniref:prephenate dehydrogenase/arogenate dehydrogenase family protein n=1 Tax=Candidatus Palauibacter sp. TaxID=3101350 RepID=UPI003AF2A36F
MSDLNRLRDELARIDRELLELVARRQEISASIGKRKRAAQTPTRDYSQEKVVIERARAAARELGFSPRLAEDMVLSLIRSSLAVQERGSVAAAARGGGKRALVIGGSGKMGDWFARFLSSQGFKVETADPDGGDHADWAEVRLDQDLIVVATPMIAANAILERLAEIGPQGLVFDIGSLKSPLRSGLAALARAGVRATSVHPMFGPDTELLSGEHVIVVDVGCAEAAEEADALFASTMATRVRMDLESHDRVMGFVLGLSHALNIAFFTALARSGETTPRLADVSSTTFEAQLDVARALAGENPHMYFEIQSLNEYGDVALAELVEAVEKIRDAVAAGDEDAFVALMSAGRDYLESRGAPE